MIHFLYIYLKINKFIIFLYINKKYNMNDSKFADMKENRGIFGFGISHNDNLDLFTLVILAYAGLFIQFFFSGSYDQSGKNGPASLALWGYGLTGIALFLMIFISIYINNKINATFEKKDSSITEIFKSVVLSNSLPVILSLGTILFLLFINYTFFERINKGLLPDTYNTYYLFSSTLLIVQIALIVKYLYNELNLLVIKDKTNMKENTIIKSLSYIIITLNFIFILIMYILLEFFSTNG
tara:strand:+ start:2762 stop:3481 length:720 start_codon:yes stop_codon:yes gene_type:complete